MKPIAIFYHCLFCFPEPTRVLPMAGQIVSEQMLTLQGSGLLSQAESFTVCINGGQESRLFTALFPPKAKFEYNGLNCRTECRTILVLEEWLKNNPDKYVLYFHSKGATHNEEAPLRMRWRRCMMRNLVFNWTQCVADLDSGADAVGCHWMTGDKTPPGQSIFAGNFWWATSNFLRTLPSIMLRSRIKESGLDDKISRYEAEVWIGNGPALPKVRDYHPAWIDQCVS